MKAVLTSAAFFLLLICGSLNRGYAAVPPPVQRIVHWPPSSEDLPYPGSPLVLGMQIANNDMKDKRVRLLAVVDGRLIDLTLIRIETDPHDRINYLTSVYAPIAEMSYRWLVYEADGKVIVSDRYVVKRTCVPRLSFAELHLDPKLSIPEKIEALVDQLYGMDNEIRTYEEILKTLDILQPIVKKE